MTWFRRLLHRHERRLNEHISEVSDQADVMAASRANEPGEVSGGSRPSTLATDLSIEATAATRLLVENGIGTGAELGLDVAEPGAALDRHSPFYIGLLGALGLATGYAVVLVVMSLTQVITYIIVAMFIALGLEPIIGRLARRGWGRGRAVAVTVFGLLLICGLLGWLIIPVIVDQVTVLAQRTPEYVQNIQNSHWVTVINDRFHVTDRLLTDFKSSVGEGTVTSVFGGVIGVGKAFADGVLAVFTVLVLTMYFTVAMPSVKTAVYKLVPLSRRPRVVYLSEEISRRVGGYILGQLCVAVINATLAYAILLMLGLPFPLVLAVIVGLLALVPIVGTLVGAVLLTLVALTSGWVAAVIVLGYYVAYHIVETYLISPRIMRRTVEVPPVITIVAVLAGASLLGILGALVAIPIAAGLLLIYDQVVVPRQQRA